MPKKVFTRKRRVEPIEFTLRDVDMMAHGHLSAEATDLLAEGISGANANKYQAMRRFIYASLIPKSKTEFDKIYGNGEDPLGTEELAEVFEYLAEEYGQRPTQGS